MELLPALDLLPEDLQPDHRLQASENDYPIMQTNPITGYRTSLYRSGSTSDFLGWIQLVNGNQAAGYIYIRRPGEFSAPWEHPLRRHGHHSRPPGLTAANPPKWRAASDSLLPRSSKCGCIRIS